jgi:polysaccharide export outer membrane protein
VSVSPSADRIALDLPAGAVFPLDFAGSSGGMVRGGEVLTEGDRVRVELTLSRGLLDRIDYMSDAIVLRFRSRFDANGSLASEDQYKIGPEDKLEITVHNHADLASELTVSRSGYITAPLVGDVQAEGLGPQELAHRLAELLGDNYLVDPQVDVEVAEYNSQWVMIDGETRTTGQIPIKGGTRLKDVLSEAGGFSETAGEQISITRQSDDGVGYENIKVNRKEFEAGDRNPRMFHGDIVTVVEASYCYLQGEVASPTRVRIERGLTLLQAITQAGGLTDWANRKKVKILRDGETPQLFNMRQIQAGKVADPELRGGDIVIVDRRFF